MNARSHLLACGAVAVLLPIAMAAQQRDATTTPAVPAGTGTISGVVLAADNAAQPLRRAVVTLTGGSLAARSVLSDDAGRFTIARLPAGTYTVTARKAAYLAAPYGARRPGRTGMPIALAEGQRADVRIAMFRGGVITGMLRDVSGQPIGGVDVRVIDARTLQTLTDAGPIQITTSDDRGIYRIHSLLPGDYYVAALPSASGSGAIAAPSASSIDAALAMLTSRRAPVGGAPATTPPPAERPIGFSPVYFPGTPDYRGAVRVHVDVGEERSGVDFEVRPQPVAAIDGVVRGDAPDLSSVLVTLIPSGPRVTTSMSSNSLSGRAINAQGLFAYTNLPPGSYRLVARARKGDLPAPPSSPAANTGRGGVGGGGIVPPTAPPPGGSGTYWYGFADVELNGSDVSGVTLTLQPGAVVSGRMRFAGSTPPPTPDEIAKMRVRATLVGGSGMVSTNGLMMGDGLLASPVSVVNPDGTFEIRGIGPGRYTLSFDLATPAEARGWKLRAATAAGRDLLDGALELGPGIAIPDVHVSFTDARTEISGTLQTPAGEVTTEYYIVALPADRTSWQPQSRRILSVRPATDGRFAFVDPPSGEYLIVALSDLDPIDLQDVTFLEQIAPAGVKVAVKEGERKVQDLRITRGP
jgi:hypothetical protein